ncbi:MAG TPA: YrdB family protein [Polyangiales bacterium]|nr:YrdB family protein [Polyangiales bacterium]
MLSALKVVNATLAFAIEIAMLIAFADSGFRLHASAWLRWTVAFGAPAIAIVLWAIWGAPKSATRLRAPSLYAFEWSMFAAAAAALYAAGRAKLAFIYFAIASVNMILWIAMERA